METEWRELAACKVAPDPNRFVDAVGGSKEQSLLISMYCSGCPVSDLCFEVAIRTPPSTDAGVWGGTTERQRILIRRRAKYAQKPGQ